MFENDYIRLYSFVIRVVKIIYIIFVSCNNECEFMQCGFFNNNFQ